MPLQGGAITETTIHSGNTNVAYSADAIDDDPQCFSCRAYYPDNLDKNCPLSNALIVFNRTVNNLTPHQSSAILMGKMWWIEDCPEFKEKLDV